MKKHYDVIVVGAGSMGMSAGYYLTKKGLNVLLIDAYDPPHTYGSHHGDTRIIRHAYGEGRQYVQLVLRAQELWDQLAEESGYSLFAKTGVLCIGPQHTPFMDEMIASANEFSLPLEILSHDEIRYRWRGIFVPEGFIGCFEKRAGVLFSEECLRAYRQLALSNGAEFLVNTVVEKIDLDSQGATIHTTEGAFTADQVMISTGAWTKKLLKKIHIDVPLQPVRKTVAWFECDEQLYDAHVFPAFSYNLSDENYYGFPSFAGSGLKIGRHDQGKQVDPDTVSREFGLYSEDEGDVRKFLETFMPQAAGKCKAGKVCLYTLTPDRHFIIDQLPDFPHIKIVTGFSGHGFKFASVIGEIVSELVTKGKSSYDISMFSLDRF
ncbi:N-methyl-L-tryptophan oxidase [Thermoflavimicrobium dichotomicum]|uniref:N-methyl-L-tryptophan oxidase n=1 Tax=Thermoflavimicrobium dichotomicum TaxID=46223 RepID=A0A1I3U301_9BACL|nr:N-methyl-L-tryptophan oxidase [Thermoflavimicrobium dichotomicum]SFJ77312.1 N-methyl-L-tryptophan oxidase [Thermoflavimicrobium dichotomicum]